MWQRNEGREKEEGKRGKLLVKVSLLKREGKIQCVCLYVRPSWSECVHVAESVEVCVIEKRREEKKGRKKREITGLGECVEEEGGEKV